MKKITTVMATLCLLVPASAYSQQVGKTVKVVNIVSGDHNNSVRQLAKTDPVYANENITAGPDSHGEIKLNDNSRIIVGPGSSISLDDFVIADTGIKSGAINIAKGAFRFISGRPKKATFKITTAPTTIGIRGTMFDVYVAEDGVTDVILFSGSLDVCTIGGNCRILRDNCDIVRVKSRNTLQSRNFLRSGDRRTEDRDYDLITRQGRFPFAWRAPTGGCDFRAAIENNAGESEEPEPGRDDKGGDKGEDEGENEGSGPID